jgi:hypothetical protein
MNPDLSTVASVSDLAYLLREAQLRAGKPALREIDSQGRRLGLNLPRATVGEVLAGKRLPRLELFQHLLVFFRVAEAERREWLDAWERIAGNRSPQQSEPDVGVPRPSARVPSILDVTRPPQPLSPTDETTLGGTWFFPDRRPIIIFSGSLPKRFRDRMPFTNTRDPDYVRSYSLSDLDALIEVYGHIRAVNPDADVRICRSEEMDEDDFTSHLVLIGGVDFNPVNRDITRRLNLPVRQQIRPRDQDSGYFSTADGAIFEPVLDESTGELVEDVAHFFRGVNPYNNRRTVTLCNGMYGRGTYGAVRALTNAKFRRRNEEYIRERFRGEPAFSILMRVRINTSGATATPDWTLDLDRLHEWPPA